MVDSNLVKSKFKARRGWEPAYSELTVDLLDGSASQLSVCLRLI